VRSRPDQLVGQAGLAGRVHPVDSDPDRMACRRVAIRSARRSSSASRVGEGRLVGFTATASPTRWLELPRVRHRARGRLDQDVVGVLDPYERLAALVPGITEAADRRDQVGTLGKLPRRIAWRVRIAKNTSTRFIQLAEVNHCWPAWT
jgi:hypothetical protein